MPSIAELRTICQNPITHSTTNPLDKFLMWIAIYFTWIFIKLKLTANNVTVLSGIFCIIGAFLLASGSTLMFIFGIICFILFNILDCSDGQIGRYKKQSSLYGHFLDYYMHFVYFAAMFFGLTLGALLVHFNTFMVICGFFALLTPIMLNIILNSGWTVICWERLNAMVTGKEVVKEFEESNLSALNKVTANEENNISKKKLIRWVVILFTSVFSHYAPFALSVLVVLQIIINIVAVAPFDFRPILIVYVGIIGPVYIIFVLWKRYKTNAFEDGYRRLFANSNAIKLPRDYFF